jgi:hypothetical protein
MLKELPDRQKFHTPDLFAVLKSVRQEASGLFLGATSSRKSGIPE